VGIAATATPCCMSKLCSRRRLNRQVLFELPAGYNLPSWHLPLLRLVELGGAPSSKLLTTAVSSDDSTGSLQHQCSLLCFPVEYFCAIGTL